MQNSRIEDSVDAVSIRSRHEVLKTNTIKSVQSSLSTNDYGKIYEDLEDRKKQLKIYLEKLGKEDNMNHA